MTKEYKLAGLSYVGENDEGEKEYIGSINEWDVADHLTKQAEEDPDLFTDDPEVWQEAYDEGDLTTNDFKG